MSAHPHRLLTETLISFSQAATRFPAHRGRNGCSPSCVFRWATQGVLLPDGHRLRLEAIKLASRWLTSEQAVTRFIEAQIEACTPEDLKAPPVRTPTQRQRAGERAGKALEKIGA